MADAAVFQDLLRRLRAGDAEAADELVRQFWEYVHRIIHFELRLGKLRRRLDSADICQSVMASFVVRARLGEYEVDSPEQLHKLLAVMARHRGPARRRHPSLPRRVLPRPQRMGQGHRRLP